MEKVIERIKSYCDFNETQVECVPLSDDILGVIVPKTKGNRCSELERPCAILLNSHLVMDEYQQKVWTEYGESLAYSLQKLDCDPLMASLVYIIMLIEYGHVDPAKIHIVDFVSMHSNSGGHILANIVSKYKAIIQHKDETDSSTITAVQITNGDEATNTKPRTLVIGTLNIPVNSWIKVLEEILSEVAVNCGEEKLAERYPKFINSDPKRFHYSRQLRDYYFNTNLSAKQIYNFCVEAMEFIGMSKETDWKVFI